MKNKKKGIREIGNRGNEGIENISVKKSKIFRDNTKNITFVKNGKHG